MPLLTLNLLGNFSARSDDQPVTTFKSITVQALLIYLAVERESGPHGREYLSELLWPGMLPASGRKNLRQTLYELRQVIPEVTSSDGGSSVPIVLSDRQTIQINPDGEIRTDVDRFERWLRKKEPEEMARAVELYRGDFLSDFYLPGSADFEEWTVARRSLYRQQALEAMTALAQDALDRHEYEQGLEYARRQLRLENLHEPAHRQLMEAMARSGRRPEALNHYEQFRQLLKAEVGVEPSASTEALVQQIVEGQIGRVDEGTSPVEVVERPLPGESRKTPHNLPAQPTPFIGRQEELEEILGLLEEGSDVRLLTLLGPGGSGKTRLALEAARRVSEEADPGYPDGIWFVPLDNLVEPESIITAVADALDFNISGQDDPHQQLLGYLSTRRMLLVLDNYEHLLQQGVNPLAAEIISSAKGIKVLVTSRSRLNVLGERLFLVGGLSLPELGDRAEVSEVSRYDALRLFQQSAVRVQTSFELTAANLPAVLEICQLLQGMPLGIELAASWIPILSPTEIAGEISRGLDILESQWQDQPERQRSLRAVFESSWRMLSSREREIVASLSIFQGTFRRVAAQEISGATLQELLALSSKSWLIREPSGDYQIHMTLRQYCRERLQQDRDAWHRARSAHALYHFSLVVELNGEMRGPDQKTAIRDFSQAFEDIRVAWDYVTNQGRWKLLSDQTTAGMLYFASARDIQARDVLSIVRAAREKQQITSSDLLSGAILGTAEASLTHGLFVPKQFIRWFETSGLPEELILKNWEVLKDVEPSQVDVIFLVLSALLYGWLVNTEPAIDRLRQLVNSYRLDSDRWSLAYSLEQLGRLLSQAWFPSNIRYLTEEERLLWGVSDTSGMQRAEDVHRLLEESVSHWEEVGDMMQQADTLKLLAFNLERHQPDRAIEALQQARRIYHRLGDDFSADLALRDIAEINLHNGNIELAFENYRESRALAEDLYSRQVTKYSFSLESINTARYGDLEYARQLRIQNTTFAQEMGETLPLAWSIWEMGEIERLSGNLDKARRMYEQAQQVFVQNEEIMGLAFYYKGLGDIALAKEEHEEAHRCFDQALDYAARKQHDWTLVYCLCGLARADIALGRLEAAYQALSDALRESRLTGFRDLLPIVFSCFAQLHDVSGAPEKAIVLANFAADLKTAWKETKKLATLIVEEVAAKLPAEAVEAAMEKSRQLDIPGAVMLALSVRI